LDDLFGKSGMAKQNHSFSLRSKSCVLLLSTVLLGIFVDVLFYDKALGVSYPIFVTAFYALFFWNLRNRIQVRFSFGWLLLIPIFMLAFTYLFFSNMIFYVLNFIAVPFLIVVQTLLVTDRATWKWHSARFIIDLLYSFFYRPFAYVMLPFVMILKFLHAKTGINKDNVLLKVFFGILITIPLLVLIISLLASADEVFGHLVGQIPSFFTSINLGQAIAHFLLAAIVAVVLFSYIWSLMRPKPEAGLLKEWSGMTAPNDRIDPVIATTLLSIINAIYVLFTFIQFSYLFGGLTFALPAHFTYAGYARRGFFELIVVTLINFSILLTLICLTKKSGRFIGRSVRILESLLVVCTLVMLLSAFFRMALYEQMYGYTYLRLLTHAFMIFLFTLFVLTFWRIWKEKVSLSKYYLMTAIAAYVVINYANIDALITKYNIERYQETGKIDIAYLSTLSDDAVAGSIGLLHAKEPSVAGRMENMLYFRNQELSRTHPWQSFNLSQYRAKQLLSGYTLHYQQQYKLNSDGSPDEP
jgi:hypothetical protein